MILLPLKCAILAQRLPVAQEKRYHLTATCSFLQPPPKPKARANEPKPPRVTPPDVADDDDPELPKKPKLEERLYPLPPPEPPRDVQLAGVAGPAMPGGVGWQVSPVSA